MDVQAHQNETLIRMANQIGHFFRSYPHDKAVKGIADHLNQFWDKRMRRAILDHVAQGGEGLEPLTLEALQSVRRPKEN